MSYRRPFAVAAALVFLLAPGCARGEDAPADLPAAVDIDTSDGTPTDEAIAEAQERLADVPEDDDARLALAVALLQKVREAGDPSLYEIADQLLDDLGERRSDDASVLVAQGTLAMARHEFERGYELATKAVELAPELAAPLGLLADAANELGRYEESLEATQAMLDIRPDLAALSRASYARELRGDLDGAIALMAQAAASGASGENLAYVQVLLGQLLLTRGDLDDADAALDEADRAFPGLVATTVARARVAIARDDLERAVTLLEEVVATQPTIENVALLADTLEASGDDDAAAEQVELVAAIAELYASNGVTVDVDLAIFDANHSPGDDAIEQAESAVEVRPGILGQDALAWALHTGGEDERALDAIEEALSLGSIDPQIRFHAAAITHALGDKRAAREHLELVLSTNPRFSPLHIDDVERLAADLGLEVPPVPTERVS